MVGGGCETHADNSKNRKFPLTTSSHFAPIISPSLSKMKVVVSKSSLLLVLGTLLLQIGSVVGIRGELNAAGPDRNLKTGPVSQGSASLTACQNALPLQPKDYACACDSLNVSDTALSCLDVTCTYCSSNDSVCGTGMYEQLFSSLGDVAYIAETFMYEKGLSENVTVALSDCTTDLVTSQSVCQQCEVYVGDAMCNSCELVNCTSGPAAGTPQPSFECGNLVPGSSYNLCDTSFSVPSTSPFQFLMPGSFNNCSLTSAMPTGHPTTAMPSGIPSDMPSLMPSGAPSTSAPSVSEAPSMMPSTGAPTKTGTTRAPSMMPTVINYTYPPNTVAGATGSAANNRFASMGVAMTAMVGAFLLF